MHKVYRVLKRLWLPAVSSWANLHTRTYTHRHTHTHTHTHTLLNGSTKPRPGTDDVAALLSRDKTHRKVLRRRECRSCASTNHALGGRNISQNSHTPEYTSSWYKVSDNLSKSKRPGSNMSEIVGLACAKFRDRHDTFFRMWTFTFGPVQQAPELPCGASCVDFRDWT